MKNKGTTSTGNTGSSLGKWMVYITLFSVLGLVAYNYFFSKDGGFGDYTRVPKELQINYIPSDFNFELDEENALAILSNPHRYRREFNELIYNFNLALLYHVANRMNLPDSLKNQLRTEYDKHHDYLKDLYFKDFIALRDTSANLYEAWYDNESTSAVEVLNEVASKYTCFLVNHVITTLLKANEGVIAGKGTKVDTPCGIAMTEGLRPMIKRLQQSAAIADFGRSRGLMEERVEKVIAELATVEIRDKKGINRQLQTKIWGYAVSSTDIEVSAISLMKIGFKLDRYFNLSVDSRNKTVWVTLPEPEILSHEVYPKVDKLDVGWLREVSNDDLNKNFNILRSEFRRDALESDVFDRSKSQAEQLMDMMLSPAVQAIGKDYKVRVQYKKFVSDQPEAKELPAATIKEPEASRIESPDRLKQ